MDRVRVVRRAEWIGKGEAARMLLRFKVLPFLLVAAATGAVILGVHSAVGPLALSSAAGTAKGPPPDAHGNPAATSPTQPAPNTSADVCGAWSDTSQQSV